MFVGCWQNRAFFFTWNGDSKTTSPLRSHRVAWKQNGPARAASCIIEMQFKRSSEEFLQLWRRPMTNLTSNKDNRRKHPLKDRGNFFSLKSILRGCLLIQYRLISWGPDKSVLLIISIYLMWSSLPLSKNEKSQGEQVTNKTEPYLTENSIIRSALREISLHIYEV